MIKNGEGKKLRNVLPLAVGAVVLAIIIIVPVIYFNIDDGSMNGKRIQVKDIQFSLDDKVENIYMVNRIHSLIGSFYLINSNDGLLTSNNGEEEGIYISGNYEDEKRITTKLYNEKDFVKWLLASFQDACDQVSKEKCQEVIQIVCMDEDRSIAVKYDSKSKKVFEAYGRWSKTISDREVEKALRRVLNYEGLLVVGDWYYSDKKMISRNASLALNFSQDNGEWQIYFEAI